MRNSQISTTESNRTILLDGNILRLDNVKLAALSLEGLLAANFVYIERSNFENLKTKFTSAIRNLLISQSNLRSLECYKACFVANYATLLHSNFSFLDVLFADFDSASFQINNNLSVDGSNFSDNLGSIFSLLPAVQGPSFDVNNSSFQRNQADWGTVFFLVSSRGPFYISNTEFIDNVATGRGSVLYADYEPTRRPMILSRSSLSLKNNVDSCGNTEFTTGPSHLRVRKSFPEVNVNATSYIGLIELADQENNSLCIEFQQPPVPTLSCKLFQWPEAITVYGNHCKIEWEEEDYYARLSVISVPYRNTKLVYEVSWSDYNWSVLLNVTTTDSCGDNYFSVRGRNSYLTCIPYSDWLLMTIIPSLGVLFIIIGGLSYYLHARSKKATLLKQLACLPDEISNSFKDALLQGSGWKLNEGNNLLVKTLVSEEDQAFPLQIFDLLAGKGLKISEFYAVCNPILISAFANTYQIFLERITNSQKLFFQELWRNDEDNKKLRKWTARQRASREAAFSWNSTSLVSVLPVIHGTSMTNAWPICCSGFATLSQVDAGWFGSGMYFTTNAKYALPYFAGKPDPAIIISFLILGNSYPVIEHPTGPDSLSGTTIKVGYRSHYVVTSKTGMPFDRIPSSNTRIYDEIVINQESQVCPAYVLALDSSNFASLITDYQRVLPEGVNDDEEEEEPEPSESIPLLNIAEGL